LNLNPAAFCLQSHLSPQKIISESLMKSHHKSLWRPTGAVVIASLTLPTLLAGCGAPAPNAQAPRPQNRPAASQGGMSTGQKVKLLAGAAAVYYLYRKYQRDNAAKLQQAQAQAPGGKIQYYRSRSKGFIYYRDPQTKQAIIVAPAPNQVPQQQVPEAQAREYSNFQGYDGSQTGETLDKYFPVQ
jgi:hypothetical protein